MEFNIQVAVSKQSCAACAIIGVYEKHELSSSGQRLDKASEGAISKLLKRGDLDEKFASTLLLHDVPNVNFERVLLISLGKQEDFSAEQYREINRVALGALLNTPAVDVVNYLSELACAKHSIDWKIEQAVLAANDSAYRFEQFKVESKAKDYALKQITLVVSCEDELKQAKQGLKRGLALSNGIKLAKDLGNMPANLCTPTYLASCAKDLAKKFDLEIEVLDAAAIKKEKMNTLLSVAQGSSQPPCFIVLKYNGATDSNAHPIVLVGKGITFDSGGISLKPASGMEEMKYDMSGAGAVLGAFHVAVENKLAINLVALIPTCENMPSANASRPGDIVISKQGLSVEIINTDAEGRLILCDALSYAKKFKPQAVIDVATLTGACIIALGSAASAVFANQDDLAGELVACGEASGDRAWHLPMWEHYQKQIKSTFADIANVGGREAGSITAACFLSRFAKDFAWAHLDVAGTASWRGGNGAQKGSTGRPVGLLVEFLRSRASASSKKSPKEKSSNAKNG